MSDKKIIDPLERDEFGNILYISLKMRKMVLPKIGEKIKGRIIILGTGGG